MFFGVSAVMKDERLVNQAISMGIIGHSHKVLQEQGVPDEADPTKHPLRFLLGVILDQSMDWERAWRAPRILEDRLRAAGLGPLTSATLASLEPKKLAQIAGTPPKLHRFPEKMSDWIQKAAFTLNQAYDGDPAKIWTGAPRALEVMRRFDRFEGIGQKKSSMATNILARDYGVPISGWEDIDVSYDIHVRRVFLRTGLATKDTEDEIVAVARELNPQYPGDLDVGSWDIGKNWCRPSNPDCEQCPLESLCPKLTGVRVPTSA